MGLILAVAVALVAIMFATGNTTPRLGVDLAGGTTVTLKAVAPANNPGAVNGTSMNEAVSILQQRVNGMGVSEATVQTEGSDTIVVTIPKGNNTTQIAQEVGTTAKLYFRPVLAEAPSGVTVSSSASASASASGTASASASSTASAQAQAPASGSASATPSASKTQGDAVTGDLTKATPSASTTAKASASATAKASATATSSAAAAAAASSSAAAAAASLTTGTVPADLTTAFANLDCSKQNQRVDHQTDQAKDAVACSSDASAGYYIKYALGPVAVPGTDISSASAGISTQNGGWQVNLNFTSSGGSKFTTVTTALAKNTTPANQFAIVLDGKVQSAPSVSSAITGGQAQITGSFTQQQATSLANVLSYGALPLDFKQQDVTTVSPELGSSQLTAGLVSGAIGLALVILYSLLYYRGLGLVAIAGLAVSAVLTYAIMCLLGATIGFALNLPAVCGAIVAIGITADSFVVYFERIRDELRHGSSLRPAVQRAWPKARRTILVADFVSFLAAAVLYFFTVGKVQGFAFTLGLTTILDVVVIFLFTKPLITLLARRKFFAEGHPMSGLDPKRLGVRPPLRGGRRPVETKEA